MSLFLRSAKEGRFSSGGFWLGGFAASFTGVVRARFLGWDSASGSTSDSASLGAASEPESSEALSSSVWTLASSSSLSAFFALGLVWSQPRLPTHDLPLVCSLAELLLFPSLLLSLPLSFLLLRFLLPHPKEAQVTGSS